MTERIFPTDAHGNPLGPAREEIVRCGDCRHCMAYTFATYCVHMAHAVKIDGFCAWGARADA